jgi:hypothetical protein
MNDELASKAITLRMTDSNLHLLKEEAHFVKGISKDP